MKRERRQFGKGDYNRRIGFRESVQTFLIVCEGSRTEPYYFEAFRVPKDVRRIEIKGTGMNTIKLVKATIDFKKREKYDQVWCVLDADDFPKENINHALALAAQNGIQVAFSNQCFELWYLLHFNYYNAAMSREQYQDVLEKLLKHPYDKSCGTTYYELVDLQWQAIRNAERLLKQYQPYDPATNDPSTTVHLLVRELNRFNPDSRD